MCMMPPRSRQEWVVGLVTTVLGSVSGGAAVVQHFGLQAWAHDYVGLMALVGVAFACGLPAWMVVRWGFNYMVARQSSGIDEVVAELRKRTGD
jgi:hypothetical protein